MKSKKPFLISCFAFVLTCSAASAVQTIDGSGGPITVELNSNGESSGVSFINQAAGECTLSVSQGNAINKDNNTDGITTDANFLGNVSFHQGSSGIDVKGKVGTPAFFLDTIGIGDGNVNFSGPVHCNTLTFFGLGKATLNADLDLGPGGVVFTVAGSGSSILELADNVVATGTIGNNPSNGQLYLKRVTTVNGDVVVFVLKYATTDSVGQEGAVINGNLVASILDLGIGAIAVNGNLNLASPSFMITHNSMNASSVNVSGTSTYTGTINIKYHFDYLTAPRGDPQIQIVYSPSGGTSGAPINVTTNDWRVYFTGENTNGNIVLNGRQTSAVVPATEWWVEDTPFDKDPLYELLTVAYAFPGSDLDFIEGQLGSPTYQGYVDYLYQLYPAPALVGVARESFNTTKQFQRIYLEHLQRDRSLCASQKLCGPKDACVDKCKGLKVWTDGFRYYGKRDNQGSGKGYKANTLGVTVAAEQPINEFYRCGGGLGYAYSSIRKDKLNRNTPANHTHIHQYEGTFYSTFDKAHWFADIGLSFAWNHYDGKRHIDFHLIDRTARSSYNGKEYSAFIDTGYQYCSNRFEITPIASLIYSYLHIDSHKESGAKTLNLRFTGQNYQFLESSLGLKAAYDYETSWGFFIPEARAMWLYDFFTESVNVKASYSKLGAAVGSFRNKGPHTDRNTLNVGGSVTFLYNTCFSMTLDWDFEVSNHYYDNQGLIEFSYVF
ncbi:MAG: autotransporter outer membrane beta-barrel domain-containing protein [Parachlamydiales bacterium]|nr:autotransporter outer membrane beta-barrel domain-containing protein [Candidatus Acheromyda pituitae]